MAQIAVQPIYLKDCLLTISGSDFEKHVSNVTFSPTVASATWKGLNPDAVFTNVGSSTWMVQLDYAQDWETAGSLSAYLFNNEGAEVTLTFEPVTGGSSWSADVVVVPGAVGGAIDSFAVASVQLPVQGRPVFTPAV
jgi:hypothetical protein